VANNLNDIGKDHPELLAAVARRWLRGATPERRWVVNHALRSAVKRADAGALKALGYGGKVSATVADVEIKPRSPFIGGHVAITFTLKNTARTRQRVMADLVVHFVKSRATGAKTFKMKAVELAPGECVVLSKRISLRQLTTRRHYPGTHRVEALLNGVRRKLGEFRLRA
jgi:hypothetical protein